MPNSSQKNPSPSIIKSELLSLILRSPILENVDFSFWEEFFRYELLEELAKKQPNLKSFSLTYSSSVKDADIEALTKTFPNLTDTDFTGCTKLTSKSLETLAENCKELTGLGFNLTKFYDEKLNLNDKQLIDVLKNFKQLKNLSLDYFYQKLSDKVIDEILIHCPNLESLTTTTAQNQIEQTLPGELNLNDENLIEYELVSSIDDKKFIEMAQNISRLEKIDASNSPLITEESLKNINLQHLTDIKFHYVNKEMLELISKHCKNLKIFTFISRDSEINDKDIDNLIINCPQLELITIPNGSTLQGEELQQRRARLMQSLPQLELITISNGSTLQGEELQQRRARLMKSRPTLVATDLSGVATDLAQASRYRG